MFRFFRHVFKAGRGTVKATKGTIKVCKEVGGGFLKALFDAFK